MTGLPTGSYSGGAGGASGPSTASANNGFDSSGWNVNFGAGSIDSGNSKLLVYTLIAAGVYLVWKTTRRGR